MDVLGSSSLTPNSPYCLCERKAALDKTTDAFTETYGSKPSKLAPSQVALATPHHATPCLAKLRQVTPNHATQSHATPSHAKPSQTSLRNATPSQAKPSHARPSQTTPVQAKSSQATPGQTRPSHTSPCHASPHQAKPSHATPNQATPRHAKPSQATPSQAKPSQATSSQVRRIHHPSLRLQPRRRGSDCYVKRYRLSCVHNSTTTWGGPWLLLLTERLPGQRDGRLHNVSGLVPLALLLQLLPSALAPSRCFQDRSNRPVAGEMCLLLLFRRRFNDE